MVDTSRAYEVTPRDHHHELPTTLCDNVLFAPKRFDDLPTNSWTMNRETRVPASMVVKMNSASNMIAK